MPASTTTPTPAEEGNDDANHANDPFTTPTKPRNPVSASATWAPGKLKPGGTQLPPRELDDVPPLQIFPAVETPHHVTAPNNNNNILPVPAPTTTTLHHILNPDNNNTNLLPVPAAAPAVHPPGMHVLAFEDPHADRSIVRDPPPPKSPSPDLEDVGSRKEEGSFSPQCGQRMVQTDEEVEQDVVAPEPQQLQRSMSRRYTMDHSPASGGSTRGSKTTEGAAAASSGVKRAAALGGADGAADAAASKKPKNQQQQQVRGKLHQQLEQQQHCSSTALPNAADIMASLYNCIPRDAAGPTAELWTTVDKNNENMRTEAVHKMLSSD